MVKEFKNLTQLNRFEKLNKSKKIIDIVYNAENKLWVVTFNGTHIGLVRIIN